MTREEEAQIIEDNLWLVEFVAKKYRERADWSDMVSAGRYGLVRGIRKYDPDRGKPSTYLIHWVRAEILKCLYEDRNVHVPWNRINKYIKEKGKANFSDGKYPQFEISLNKPTAAATQNDNDSGADSIEYQSSLSSAFTSNLESKENSEHILHLFDNSKLTDIEQSVIIHRFGLYGENSKTLKEVGNLLGYSAMGVQKIQVKGINKMSKNKKLLEYAR